MVIDISVLPFNEIVTFISGAVMPIGSSLTTVADDLAATGNNRATAAPLIGQTNIIRSGVIGGGLYLPLIIKGTIVVINEWVQDIIIFPPSGARLNALAQDQGVIISAHGKVEFSTASGSVKWVAR